MTSDAVVPDGFAEAIEQFNSWRFYDCHETLEDIWRETGPKGDEASRANFYQGLIKAAAGYHHLLRGNYNGVMRVLGDVPRLLAPYRPRTLGVDVEGLVAAVEETLGAVQHLGPERLADYDRGRIPVIVWDQQPEVTTDEMAAQIGPYADGTPS